MYINNPAAISHQGLLSLTAGLVLLLISQVSLAEPTIEWVAIDFPEDYLYADERLAQHWDRLHHSDREPWPDRESVALWLGENGYPEAEYLVQALREAWRDYHAGRFESAWQRGRELGLPGAYVASRALGVHTMHLADSDKHRELWKYNLDLLRELDRKDQLRTPNMNLALVYVAARYAQNIGIFQAMRQRSPNVLRQRLEAILEDAPDHPEAHLGLGGFHAELIGRLGATLARLGYDARAKSARQHYQRALELAPQSILIHVEYAHGVLMMDRDGARREAIALLENALELTPLDAAGHLEQQRAREMLDRLNN